VFGEPHSVHDDGTRGSRPGRRRSSGEPLAEGDAARALRRFQVVP
jgi:hypothetical protein